MKSTRTLTRNQKRNLFFGLMITVPLILFVIFYGIVNVNTILLAFKNYELLPGDQIGYKVTFAGFENFAVVFKMVYSKAHCRNCMRFGGCFIGSGCCSLLCGCN